jgi:hypothetical protein
MWIRTNGVVAAAECVIGGRGGVLCEVFLIGYGAVAGFNVGDEKPPHY